MSPNEGLWGYSPIPTKETGGENIKTNLAFMSAGPGKVRQVYQHTSDVR